MKSQLEYSGATSTFVHYLLYIDLLEKLRRAATEEEADAIVDRLDYHYDNMSEGERLLCSHRVVKLGGA